MKEKPAVPKEEAQPERVANIKQGQYSDGHPLDTIQYLEAEIILKGDRFTSVQNFHDFAKFVTSERGPDRGWIFDEAI